MIPITFRQLEVFVRVVEAGSFRACAEQLSISLPSVAEHVRALEKQLDCALFERRRGSAALLTHMGDQVFRRAQAILGQTVDLLATFDQVPRDRMRRRIRIGAHGFIAERLAKRLATFVGSHPDVDIELELRSFAEMISGLQQSEIEIGYFLARGSVPEVESFIAWQERIALFTGSGHRLAGQAHVEPADLSGLPFTYLPGRTHLRGEIDAMLTDLGIAGCPAAVTTDDYRLIVENLAAGTSFALMFADSMQLFVDSGKLARLSFARPIPPIQIRYAVRPAYRADRMVRSLLEAINAA